ncbi:MAG: hypothetical protein AB1563_09745 [Bacillota bacterium]
MRARKARLHFRTELARVDADVNMRMEIQPERQMERQMERERGVRSVGGAEDPTGR